MISPTRGIIGAWNVYGRNLSQLSMSGRTCLAIILSQPLTSAPGLNLGPMLCSLRRTADCVVSGLVTWGTYVPYVHRAHRLHYFMETDGKQGVAAPLKV